MTESRRGDVNRFDIQFSESSLKDLRSLPEPTYAEVLEKVQNVAEVSERSPANRLSMLSKMAGLWKSYLSVEGYWVLYSVDPQAKKIHVLGITRQPNDADSPDSQKGL